LNSCIRELDTVAKDAETDAYKVTSKNMGDITIAMERIDWCKLHIIARETTNILKTQPTAKVVIGVNYHSSVDALTSMLSDYGPLVITGKTPSNKRIPIVNKFNEENTNYRILIGTVSCLNAGINLHDKNGGFPRFSFRVASYKIQSDYQFDKRTHRTGVKSNATVRVVYGDINKIMREDKILSSLVTKGSVMERMVTHTDEEGNNISGEILFPNKYPEVIIES
jgi:hypothetical protein